MYEVKIKIIGFSGVTKPLFRSERKAIAAVALANSTAGVTASYKKLY